MQSTPHSYRPQIATAFSVIALLALTLSHGFAQEIGDGALFLQKAGPVMPATHNTPAGHRWSLNH